MTISKEKFSQVMTELTELYGKSLSKTVLAIWFEHLGENLDDDRQLWQAFKLAIVNCKFMPTPDELVSLVRGSRKDRDRLAAEAEWLKITEAIQAGEVRSDRVQLSPAGCFALKASGGLYKIACSSEESWRFIKRDFVDLYCACSSVAEVPAPPPSQGAAEGVHQPGEPKTELPCDPEI